MFLSCNYCVPIIISQDFQILCRKIVTEIANSAVRSEYSTNCQSVVYYLIFVTLYRREIFVSNLNFCRKDC